jgi:hypothetical protein
LRSAGEVRGWYQPSEYGSQARGNARVGGDRIEVIMSGTRKSVDWQVIGRDYRAGILSLRELAAMHGISHVAIKKHADKERWSRDLSARIQAKADEIVNRNAANSTVNTGGDAAGDAANVDANAQVVAAVRLRHRKDITRLTRLCASLLGELELQCADPAVLAQFGEILRDPKDHGGDRVNNLYQRIVSTPGRIDAAKKLAETMRVAVALEREAYGLAAATVTDEVNPLAALLKGMKQSALPVVADVPADQLL